MEDNYRYIGFTDTLVNIGEGFLAEDGIFKVLPFSNGLAQVFCFYRLSCGFPGAGDRNLPVQCPRPSCSEQAVQCAAAQEQVEKTTLDVTDVFFQPSSGKLV